MGDYGDNVNINSKSEAEAVATIVQKLSEVQPIGFETKAGCERNAMLLAVPAGRHLVDARTYLEEVEGAPWRSRGDTNVDSIESLVDMVRRHASESSVIYVEAFSPQPVVTAVLNDDATGKPGFRDWVVRYVPKLSDEWNRWHGSDGASMGMQTFGEHIEDNILDILDPKTAPKSVSVTLERLAVKAADAATLQGLAREFHVNVNHAVKEARNLQSGETQLIFDEGHTDAKGKPIRVPGAFIVKIPMFQGGDPFAIVARLRYRVRSGQITWSYHLFRTDLIQRTVMSEMVEKLRSETDQLVVIGRPGHRG